MVHIQTFGHIPSLLFYLGRYFFSTLVYDKYFNERSKEVRNIETLIKILPKKKLTILFSHITPEGIKKLQEEHREWEPEQNVALKGRHDRYIVVDDKLEIILSSGFDHLSADSSDFMYVVRVTDKSRFNN